MVGRRITRIPEFSLLPVCLKPLLAQSERYFPCRELHLSAIVIRHFDHSFILL